MKMIKAVVRPEKAEVILEKLMESGFPAATRMQVLGKGKQKGLKVGDIYYDEIPKELIMVVVQDNEAKTVTDIIVNEARTGKAGTYGDGKIFISSVEEAITISSGKAEL